ncbi:MAG TPA: hypothetical protein VK970_23815 [Candidatus Methylacidiphilales bacterium]|nr:hypothetical protein [Candidatus Methylacidiphilales bacterium]
MAIFGELSDMPLADVLALMGKGFCKVTISKLSSNQSYELLFHDKCLFSIRVDNKQIEDVLGVSMVMGNLIQARQGEFRLDRKIDADLATTFSYVIPVEQLLLSSMAANKEMESLKDHFPSEMTVFIFSNKHDCWMEDELQLFCDLAGPLLERGASGHDIFSFTGLEMDRVLLNLYKLRSAGLIAPHRAAAPTLSKAGAVAAVTAVARRPIFTEKKVSPPSDKLTPRIVFKETQDLFQDHRSQMPPAAACKSSPQPPVSKPAFPATASMAKPVVPAAAIHNAATSKLMRSVPAAPGSAATATGGLCAPPVPGMPATSITPRPPSTPPRPSTAAARKVPGVPAPVVDLRNIRVQRPKAGLFSRILEKLSSSLVKQ